MTRSLRIGIAVQGRFHAFPLASGLVALGHDVTLFTNYPARIAQRFGAPADRVRSNVAHGIAARLQSRLTAHRGEAFLHRWFGRWAAAQLVGQEWDFTHVWSGVAREWLATPQSQECTTVVRGSAHIRVQRELLDEEAARAGADIDRPSDWMIAREEAEYARALRVVVPSTFALETFIRQGVPRERVSLLPLAALTPAFRAPGAALAERVQRLSAGAPLRLIYVGTVSFQKGMHDFEAIARALPADRFEFRAAGRILPECQPLAKRLEDRVHFLGALPEAELPAQYQWADLLLLPSIQDGFAIVLSQAASAGVPFLGSLHSGAPDLVIAGVPGWVLPPRSPEAWVDRIRTLDRQRDELIEAVQATRGVELSRSWNDVAGELVQLVCQALNSR